MKILLLEPFLGESHKAWAEGYARHSRHEVEVLGLPGRHWKWRMHGAAETFARMFRERGLQPDLILATDMLDLAGFLALTRSSTAQIPAALYFHENQLAYPWSPTDPDVQLQRDNHYAYINYRSALVADAVFYNSSYNRDSFMAGLEPFLKGFPDYQELGNVEAIRRKSQVLSLGMELPEYDPTTKALGEPPLVIWNHRWEYDKGPELFFQVLMELAQESEAFRVAVLGRAYAKVPAIFEEAKSALGNRIIHYGFLENPSQYLGFLKQGHVLPVTSSQDFFGTSVVEAMHFGCMPLLPDALAYPGHVPSEYQPLVLYKTPEGLKERLRSMLRGDRLAPATVHKWAQRYRWEGMAPQYDAAFEKVCEDAGTPGLRNSS